MTKVLIRFLLLIGAIGLVGACIAAEVPAGVVLHAKQEFVRNNGSEPETLDPALVESVVASAIVVDLFEGLTSINTSGKVVAGVAESWRQVDATTWVFNLRRTAVFSNGDPVTAADFVYAWRRYLDPKTAAYATTNASFLLNGRQVNEGKLPPAELGVKALDAYTLQVKTAKHVPFLPELMASPPFSPVSQKIIEKFGKDWTKPGNHVGNGAFTLKEWQVNSKIVLERNPRYWAAGSVVLTKVTYLTIEDQSADIKLFQAGGNDMVDQLPAGTYEYYKKTHPRDVKNGTMLGLRFYALNHKVPLLQDVRVRKALSMVIDREVLASKVTADGQIPVYGLVVRGIGGADLTRYEWADWPMAQKVEAARKLLAEAGVKPGTKLQFTYNTSEYHKKVAIFTASEWKTKLGLDVELDSMEFKVLIKKRHDGEYQVARHGWMAEYNDITNFLALVQCDSDTNDSKSCNRKGEELIQEGNNAADPARRKALLTQAAKLIMDDYPIIPLLQYTSPRLVKSYVGGYFESNPIDRARSQDFYIIRH